MSICWGIEYYAWTGEYDDDASWLIDSEEGVFLDRQVAETRVSECNEFSRQQYRTSGLSWDRPMYRISQQIDLHDQKKKGGERMIVAFTQYSLMIENNYGDQVIALSCDDPVHQIARERSCGSFSAPTLQEILESVRSHQETYHSDMAESLVNSRWLNKRTGRISKVLRTWPTPYGLQVDLVVQNGKQTRTTRSLDSLREFYLPYAH